jgi:hypothetical protein
LRGPPLLIAAALLGCSSGGATKKDGAANDATNDLTVPNDGGGAEAGMLDCAWLEGSANCWQSTFAPATSCLPPTTESGTLSADNKTCTYASGVVVTFATPVVLPVPNLATWDLTMTGAGGQPCLQFKSDQAGLSLTVGGQTFREMFLGGNGLQFTCPDGSVVSTPDAYPLLTCPAAGPLELPSAFWSSTDTSLDFGLQGTSTLSTLLFSCTKS